jgi:hypothetical protein
MAFAGVLIIREVGTRHASYYTRNATILNPWLDLAGKYRLLIQLMAPSSASPQFVILPLQIKIR